MTTFQLPALEQASLAVSCGTIQACPVRLLSSVCDKLYSSITPRAGTFPATPHIQTLLAPDKSPVWASIGRFWIYGLKRLMDAFPVMRHSVASHKRLVCDNRMLLRSVRSTRFQPRVFLTLVFPWPEASRGRMAASASIRRFWSRLTLRFSGRF